MVEIMMSEMGFWVVFTMLFMFAFMGFVLYKMVKLSGEKAPTVTDSKTS